MNRVSRIALGLALAAGPMTASAQSTAVSADVGARGLGTTVAGGGGLISIDGGTLAGANLFHSFSQFSLGAGDTAQWTRAAGDAGAIRNVINRVTGGQASQISGTLDSTGLPNASFYFINPAGIVFGAGARVNVPAAAYFSTAAELRFADGATFAVATPGGSTLSVAAPESFGFVGGQGTIAFQGVGETFATRANTLSFSGAEIAVDSSRLIVRGLDMVAVGDGATRLTLADPLFASGGALQITNSQLVATADAISAPLRLGGAEVDLSAANIVSDSSASGRGGDVQIVAGLLNVTGGTLGATTRGAGPGGDVDIFAGDVTIDGGIFFGVTAGSGQGGRFAITADTIDLRNNATLSTVGSGTGRSGDVEITAATSLFADSAFIISSAIGDGDGGTVRITAPFMELGNSLAVASSSAGGRAGDVSLLGGFIDISGGAYGSTPGSTSDTGNLTILATQRLSVLGGVFTSAGVSDRQAGSIFIRAPEVFIQEGLITSSAFGEGGAGAVMIDAGRLVFVDTDISAEAQGVGARALGLVQIKSTGDLKIFGGSITSDATGAANGGRVSIEGRDVLFDDAQISSDTIGSGDGGRVFIKADTLSIHNGGVTTTAFNAGNAGEIMIEARTLTMDFAAAIRSDTLDEGDAGKVSIKTGSLQVLDGASITSRAQFGTGDAGLVSVEADSILLFNGNISSGTDVFGDAGDVIIKTGSLTLDSDLLGMSFINSETRGFGNAGSVTVTAKTVDIRKGGNLSSNTLSDGHAGLVTVKADTINIATGGFIASDSFGLGDAGDVSIVVAGTLKIDGAGDEITYISSDSLEAGNAGSVSIVAKSIILDNSGFISSDTFTQGDAGDITVKADTITLTNFGNIRSRTLSNGLGGDVSIEVGTLTLDKGGAISSEATETSVGDAGFVGIVADKVTVGDMSFISTASQGAGDAGAVLIKAGSLTVTDGGLISSAAEMGSTGGTGAVLIEADRLEVLNGGTISTLSNNPNPAGDIVIAVLDLLIDGERSSIASENQAGNPMMGNPPGPGGDAGFVNILAESGITVSNGGRISTNAFAGAAGQIEIEMSPGSILTLEGAGAPGSIETSSGRGTGGQITISQPLAIVSNGGRILALGERRGANVVIQTDYFINSSDRLNVVAVDGEFTLEAGLDDVSSGTVSRDLSVLDASKVLRGQCPVARSTGQLSQLISRPVGPYAREPAIDILQAPAASSPLGAGSCP